MDFLIKLKPEAVNTDTSKHSNIISALMNARTQFHIYHLQTTSYAAHVAIGGFYEGLTGAIDSLTETLQGKLKTIIKSYNVEAAKDYEYKEGVISDLDSLKNKLETYRTSLDRSFANIDNQVQVIIDSIESCIYKLTFLN